MPRLPKLLAVASMLTALAAGCRTPPKDDRATPTPSASATRVLVSPAAREGEALFFKYCSLCHGKDARGYAADNAPSLVSETFLASASDPFLVRSIREGRPGTAMAGYAKDRGGPLGDDEIARIVAFLREGGPAIAPLPAVGAGDATRGAVTYEAQCKSCHGTRDERGTAPQLGNPAFLAAASDPFVRYAVVKGRPGTRMVGFGDRLDDAAIDDVVAYVRSLSPPPPAPPPPAPTVEPPLDMPIVINPKGKPPTFTLREDRFVPAAEVKQALDQKRRLVVIDARAASDWNVAHIPGSIPIPYYHLGRLDQVPNDGTWIVAYCACPHHASGVIVDELKKRGHKHAVVLDEGILEWQKRKYPVVAAEPSRVQPPR